VKKHLIWLIPVAIMLFLVLGYLGLKLYKQLASSVNVQVTQGAVTVDDVASTPPQVADEDAVAQRLQEVGLTESLFWA